MVVEFIRAVLRTISCQFCVLWILFRHSRMSGRSEWQTECQ